MKKDKPRPRVHSGGNRKQMPVKEVEREEDDTENRERKISECASGNESDAFPKSNYRKVTRLSSEQIVSPAIILPNNNFKHSKESPSDSL